jgi:multidrug efflux pump subunit AcrA (membrane-fusion protein)
MRRIINIGIGVILLAGAFFITKYLIENKKKPTPKFEKIVKSVFVDTVSNKEVPIIITASGNLYAKEKIDLYAEVQGVLVPSGKEFKAGISYKMGESIIRINSDEFYANLQSQKSNFYNILTQAMPDIKLDYPKEFDKWQNYLNGFDINSSIPDLPKLNSDKEKYFISGRGINSAYYNIRNLEVKLSKYNIRAPFSGILTEALINPGSLVRVGQKLGEFINPKVYEMEVAVGSEFAELLKVGKKVSLKTIGGSKKYEGIVIRINGKVDASTQTIKAFIDVSHDDLKEGMYLEADLNARSEDKAIEISRKLLIDDKQIYSVKDSILKLIEVTPVYYTSDKVVLKGVEDGTLILNRSVPGSYDGMRVKIFEN